MLSRDSLPFKVSLLADAGVTLPLAAGLALWIAIEHWRIAGRWIVAIFVACSVVFLSKLMWAVWDWTVPGVQFRMASGHMALSLAIWPAFLGLTAGAIAGRQGFIVGRILGLMLCVAIAWSRLFGAHTFSEVLIGALLGLIVEVRFSKRLSQVTPALWRSFPFCIILILILIWRYGFISRDEVWIDRLAVYLKHLILLL